MSDGFGGFKYNATYLCDHLTHRSQDIFSNTYWFSFGGVARPKYSREPLTGLLKELLGDTKLSDSAVPISMHALQIGRNIPVTWSTFLARR